MTVGASPVGNALGRRTKASAGKIVAGALALKQWPNLISLIPKRKLSAVWQGSRFPDYKKTTRVY